MSLQKNVIQTLFSPFISLFSIVFGAYLLCFSAHSAPLSKSYDFHNIIPLQDLGNTRVTKVLQDHTGYIWIATQYGLFRFDGFSLKQFINDPQDEQSIAGNYVQNIYLDHDKRLWVSMWPHGFAQYHPESESFTNFAHDPNNANSLSSNDVADTVADEHGALWIATQAGLNKFDPQTKQFTHYQHDQQNSNSLSDDHLFHVRIDHQGMIWIGTSYGGLNRFDPQRNEFTRFQHNANDKTSISSNNVSSIMIDSQHRLWVGTVGGGLNLFNEQTQTFTHFKYNANDATSISDNYVYAIIEGEDNTLWLGTRNGGLNHFDIKQQTFFSYQPEPNNRFSLSHHWVSSLLKDRQGNIWLGTSGGGVSKFYPTEERVNLIRHDRHHNNALLPGEVTALFKSDNGDIWLNTTTGTSRFNSQTGDVIHLQQQFSEFSHLDSSDIKRIYVDDSAMVWFGTRANGLIKLNPSTGEINSYQHSSAANSISHNNILSITQDQQKNLWVATRNGLNRYNLKTNDFTRFFHEDDNNNSLSDNFVNQVFVAHDGSLWLATDSFGISRYYFASNRFIHFSHDKHTNSISNNLVYAIAQDQQQNIWIGNASGLDKFDLKTQTFSHYPIKGALSNEEVLGVFVGLDHNIWLVSNTAIFQFDPLTEQSKVIVANTSSCVASSEGAMNIGKDGTLLIGNKLGYCTISTAREHVKTISPPNVVLTDLYIFNERIDNTKIKGNSYLEHVLDHTKNLTLPHTANAFSINFSALNFKNPEANRYKYKLVGFNNEWQFTDNRHRRATYTNLPAGTYTFKISASNEQGVWHGQERELAIEILAAPWQSWWAYALYIIIILAIVFAFEYQRMQKRQLIKARNIELVRSNEQLQQAKAKLRKFAEQLEKQVEQRTLELKRSNDYLKNTQTQLVQSEKMSALGNLVVGVSHEINTPVGVALTAISSLKDKTALLFKDIATGAIKRKELDTFEAFSKESLAIALSSMERASKLVSSFKQIAVDHSAEQITTFDVLTLVQDTVEATLLQEQVSTENVDIYCNSFASVTTYSGVLVHILAQLLHNVVNHAYPPNTAIKITIDIEVAEQLVIKFKDYGKGMAQEEVKQIFDPFYTTSRGDLPGLGMSVVYNQVCEILKGTIKCISTPNKGCEFIITIPLSSQN